MPLWGHELPHGVNQSAVAELHVLESREALVSLSFDVAEAPVVQGLEGGELGFQALYLLCLGFVLLDKVLGE